MKTKISYKEYLEVEELLYTKEKDESKTRIFREFIMFVVCLLAIIYSSEVAKGASGIIKIPFIAIELAKTNVVALVPSIIMLVYLLVMSSVEKLIAIRRNRYIALFKYQEKYPSEDELIVREWFLRLNNTYLPGAIRINNKFKLRYTGISSITRSIAIICLAFIYSIAPYCFSIIAICVTYDYNQNNWLLMWNLLTVCIMLFYSTSITLGAKGKNINEVYQKDCDFIPTLFD